MPYETFTADPLDNPIDAQLLTFQASLPSGVTLAGFQVFEIAGQNQPEATSQLPGAMGSAHDVAVYFQQNRPTEARPLGVGVFIEMPDANGVGQKYGPLSFAGALNKAQGNQ